MVYVVEVVEEERVVVSGDRVLWVVSLSPLSDSDEWHLDDVW